MSEQEIISRETYKAIKKMSREELQAFLLRYANKLSENQPTIDLREVERDIKAINGIGDKRAEEVMQVIEKHLGIKN